ncbi:MAG: fasciclin domain-containing protein [Candidatus Kapabacteria bacterium]|jgi:uncharacterized surface protein with fasciclin (FAS1) repeats|nr:fasciclin domain-containing protein [Candidatus Kapabacteria bacterium]
MNNSFLRRNLVSTFLALFVVVLSASAQDKKPMNIIETATAAGTFKTLATALTEAGLVETLNGAGPFTVFAPTDAAFAKIPKEKLDALIKDKEALKKVLLYHVVSGKVMAKDVVGMNGKTAKTVQGSEAAIKVDGAVVMVDAAKVEKTDIECSNGVIHVIDSVMMPAEKK